MARRKGHGQWLIPSAGAELDRILQPIVELLKRIDVQVGKIKTLVFELVSQLFQTVHAVT